jgi:hypothetical protein
MSFIDMSSADLRKFGERKSSDYATAAPFPNISFDNFFIPERLKEILEEFPDLSKKPDIKFNDDNQIKRASRGEGRFGEKKILPLFNRMAIFSTTSTSYHGHPDPLTCPPDRTRKSLALYYYTNGRPENEVNDTHLTLFRDRPQDAGRPKYQKPKGLKKVYLKLTGKY